MPASQRVEIRQLGEPVARTVNSGVELRIGALIFALVLAAWCAGLLVVSRLVSNWKAAGRIVARGEGGWPGTRPGPSTRPPGDEGEASERREVERVL